MRGRFSFSLLAAFIGLAWCHTTSAQVLPWLSFQDSVSGEVCEVINANNVELVVLEGTGELTAVSGPDVTFADTLVDAEMNVTFEGQPAGFITFDDDADGFRALFWLSLTGRIVEVDGLTGEPFESDSFPSDLGHTTCDACDFWDDQSICESPPEPPGPITVNLCSPGMIPPMFVILSVLGLVKTRRRKFACP